MNDTYERALQEAESWLVSAKHGLAEAEDDYASANVCCAQAIHAVIRANDALSMKFLSHKPPRADGAPIGFGKLVRRGKPPRQGAEFKDLVGYSMKDKSGADY